MPGATQRLRRTIAEKRWTPLLEARRLFWTARAEHHERAPLAETVRLWRQGFTVDSARIYDFQRNDPRDYLNDYDRRYRARKLNADPAFFDHKVAQRCLLLSAGVPQPETVAIIFQDHVVLHPFTAACSCIRPEELEDWLVADGGTFVAKPENGQRGEEIYLLEANGPRLLRVRGARREPCTAIELGKKLTLIERRVEPAAFWRGLFPDSLNTIRAVTMWAPGEPTPFLARAVQRIGTSLTAPTDNFSQGGISAPIDIRAGRMGAGRSKKLGLERRFATHPDTGAQIDGAVLPCWDTIAATAVRAAASSPANRYVSWDVYVDSAGTVIVGEANHNGDVDLLQVHGGMLADPRIRDFFEQTEVIQQRQETSDK
jgi:hypothetical protein